MAAHSNAEPRDDGVEPARLAVLHGAFAAAFGDVERNRERGPARLVSQRAVPAGNPLGQRRSHAQERHRATIHIEFLEAEHGEIVGSAIRKLLGHGHGHDHDLHLHPAGVGFVLPKARRYRWLRPDPAP